MMDKIVIYGDTYGFYDIAYNDIKGISNVYYNKRIMPNTNNLFIKSLFKVVYSKKINNVITLPFKDKFFKTFLPKNIEKGDNVTFLFFSRWLSKEVYRDFLCYLKNNFGNSHYVCYFQDIVSKHSNIDLAFLRNNFDKILTYDFNDSLKYSFDYYPTPYSKIDIELDDHYSSDVYFLGFAKDRLHTILNAYDELSNHGFNCRFIIAGDIKDEIKRKYPNITFGVRIPYTENLKYVRNTKFVLEIMQTGAVGITPRVWESIAYDKYLITNNHFVKNTNVYNSDMMYVFNEYSEIPVFVEKNINRAIKYPDNLIETISPINLLKVLNFN